MSMMNVVATTGSTNIAYIVRNKRLHHGTIHSQFYQRQNAPMNRWYNSSSWWELWSWSNRQCGNGVVRIPGVTKKRRPQQQPQRRHRLLPHQNHVFCSISTTTTTYNTVTNSINTTTTTNDPHDHNMFTTTTPDSNPPTNHYDHDTPKLPTSLPSFGTTSSQLPNQLPRPIIITSNLQVGIEQQKKNAIEVWESVLRQGAFPNQRPDAPQHMPTSISYNDAMFVQQNLKEGLVPPVFHAYTIPEEHRLFHPNVLINTGCAIGGGTYDNPNDTTIRLSCQAVIPGQCFGDDNAVDYISSGNVDGIVLSESRSIIPYQPASVTTDTANTSTTTINNNTNSTNRYSATMSFECDYMTTFLDMKTGLARSHIYDPGYHSHPGWTFSTQYTQEMVHLINTPAEMIGEDVEVTALLSNFNIHPEQNDRNRTSYGTSMITRRLSRGIVLDCFKNLQRPARTYAITGSRGIGKSYTLLFALQQALLYNKMCVIFFLQKQQKAILCIRNQERVYAWESNTLHNIASSSLFTNPNVLILIDPLDAEDGGTDYALGARRLIYAASNHIEHFHKPTPMKTTNHHKMPKRHKTDKERFLSPYTDEELRVALPYMLNVNNTTFDEAMRRTYDVGTIPKYVLNDVAYEERKKQVDQYIELLKSDPKEMEQLLNWNGMIGTYKPASLNSNETPVQTTRNESQITGTITSNDTMDDTFEVDGIVVGRIGDPKRLKMENPMTEEPLKRQPIPQSPPNPGTTLFYKAGKPLPNHIDGTMILSLNTYESVDCAIPFGNKTPRCSTALIGYNGDRNLFYMRPKMTIAAPKIYDTLVQHYIKENPSYIVSLWDKVGSGYHNGMKACVSDLFWDYVLHQHDILDQLPRTTTPLNKRNLLQRWESYKLIKGKENTNPMSEWHVPIAMKGRTVAIDRDRRRPLIDLKEIFRMTRNVTPQMVRMDTNAQNIIHFAGPGRVVYQIVHDDDFTIDYNDMIKVLVYGKYLLWQQKVTKHHGTIACAPNPPVQKLEWYFIVPAGPRCAMKWEQRNPTYYELDMTTNESPEQRNERRILNRDKDQVNICIKRNVVQYVLVMDLDHSVFNSMDRNIEHSPAMMDR